MASLVGRVSPGVRTGVGCRVSLRAPSECWARAVEEWKAAERGSIVVREL